jgi:hypothetical protein
MTRGNVSIKKFQEKFKGFNAAPEQPKKEGHAYKKPVPYEMLEYRHYFFECIRKNEKPEFILNFRDYILEELNALYSIGKITRKEKRRRYRQLYYYGHREQTLDQCKGYFDTHKEQKHKTNNENYQRKKNEINRKHRERYYNDSVYRYNKARYSKKYNEDINVKVRKAKQYIIRRDRERLRILFNYTFPW